MQLKLSIITINYNNASVLSKVMESFWRTTSVKDKILSVAARKKVVESFTGNLVGDMYIELYESLMK